MWLQISEVKRDCVGAVVVADDDGVHSRYVGQQMHGILQGNVPQAVAVTGARVAYVKPPPDKALY